jgi:competence protein ComEC
MVRRGSVPDVQPTVTALQAIRVRVPPALAAWAAAERGRFVLWLPVAMAAGTAWYFALTYEPETWLGLGAALLAAVAALLCRRNMWACWICAMVCAAASGFGAAQIAAWRAPPLSEIPPHAAVVTGTVRAVEMLPRGRRITVEAASLDDAAPLARRVRLRLRDTDSTELAAGDEIRVRARLIRPAPPAYPGAWDLQRDAFFNGIGAFGYALGPSEVVIAARPSGPARWLQHARETIVARVGAVLPSPEGAIAATLLTGGTAQIPEADRAAFRDSGLAHLLAIAGLHIGIVMGLVFGATRLALAAWERAALHWPVKQIAAVSALAAGGGYMLLTGGHVPIIRSFAMASLFTLGVLAGRRALSLRALGLAMAALVLLAPNEVTGVSFQMSFSAVLALIAGYETLRPWLAGMHRVKRHLVMLALTSALAGTASAPYAAYHFGSIQLYFIIANMLAVPLAALWIMPAGLAALAVMPFHLEALALVPMGWGVEAVLWVGHTVSSWPAATLWVPHAPVWGLLVLSRGLAWLGIWRTRVRLAGIALIALGLASPAFERAPDILVSADARLIGIRTETGGSVQLRPGASNFTRDAWRVVWGDLGTLSCDTPACPLRPRADGPEVLLLTGEAGEDACTASLLVSAEPIRLRCPVPRIDRFSVWRDGAHAV